MSLRVGRARLAGAAAGVEPPTIRPTPYWELNRQILRRNSNGQTAGAIYCECGSHCNSEVELTLAECEAVRSRPDCFVIKPGHNDPTIEQIVETHPNCVLVERPRA
jgi:hypothetical protein